MPISEALTESIHRIDPVHPLHCESCQGGHKVRYCCSCIVRCGDGAINQPLQQVWIKASFYCGQLALHLDKLTGDYFRQTR